MKSNVYYSIHKAEGVCEGVEQNGEYAINFQPPPLPLIIPNP